MCRVDASEKSKIHSIPILFLLTRVAALPHLALVAESTVKGSLSLQCKPSAFRPTDPTKLCSDHSACFPEHKGPLDGIGSGSHHSDHLSSLLSISLYITFTYIQFEVTGSGTSLSHTHTHPPSWRPRRLSRRLVTLISSCHPLHPAHRAESRSHSPT